MLVRAMDNARARKKHQHRMVISDRNMKRLGSSCGPMDPLKRTKLSDPDLEKKCPLNCESKSVDINEHKPSDQNGLLIVPGDSWEIDSGFCSEASPPASGRSSPCISSYSTSVVALDCEMVGTGPGGICSEVARCSILDYHGNILYDKYIIPCQPITDFRTRWSGIQRHHLRNATPFVQAREEIVSILERKVVVGHSIYNDFEVLDILHPCHMVRDTSSTHLLSRLAGYSHERCVSLKTLTSKLLNKKIQVGRRGHCSVEDAKASLDLYKLVEGEWERELQRKLQDDDSPLEPSFASSNHYMQDEYWPDDIVPDSHSLRENMFHF